MVRIYYEDEFTEDRDRRKQPEKQYDDEHLKRKHSRKSHNDEERRKRCSDIITNYFKPDSPKDINHDYPEIDSTEDNKSNTLEYNLSEEPQKKQADEVTIKNCNATVISETLPLFESIPHSSEVTTGSVIVKIPVVLTEFTVPVTVESSLKLEDDILEIKQIRKNVFLNQCKLVPNSENGRPNTGIVFLDGFIRKNIEYAAKEYNVKRVSCGKLKHITVKVPFKCTTRVTFKTTPKFKPITPQTEVEILETRIEVCDPCKESIIGRDICEQNFKIIEFFNEKVFCELISAEIVESDILGNPTNEGCKSLSNKTFHYITEKVVLSLTIKLLQNQDIEILK